MRVLVVNDRKANKILRRAAEHKRIRDHAAYHRMQAETFRNMAEQTKTQLAEHREHMPADQIESVQTEITNLLAAAIEMDNTNCAEDH